MDYPGPDTIIAQIILQLLLIFLNAVFACAEIAVLSSSDSKLEQLAADGNKKAKKLARIKEQPAKFLSTIQVAITLSGFLASAFAADNFSYLITNALKDKINIPENVIDTAAVVLITLLLSYITLIFGELVPKRLAMKKPEKTALSVTPLVSFASKLFAPIVWLLTVSTNGVLRLFGIDPNEQTEEVTEEEIRMMVDAGSENGTIDEEEKEIIHNVFEFDDIDADQIATHRTDIALLWTDQTPEEWEQIIHDSRHTHYPLCEENIDNVVGVLNAKDYFRLSDKDRDTIIKEAVKPAYFVPESVKADVLFRNMKQKREYFAVVLDEYGGMTGIVTMTDLIESIIGDIYDDDGDGCADEEIEKLSDDTWRISGGAAFDDVCEALDISLDGEDCDTFGGYIMGMLGSVPEDGSKAEFENELFSVSVTEIKDHVIEKMTVIKKPQPEEGE